MKTADVTTREESLVAAIEGDFSRMAHRDLVLTCEMLTRGREAWRKEAEDNAKERDSLKAQLSQREVQLKKSTERVSYCEDRMAEKNTDIDRLESQLAEAGKDKERLDFLERTHNARYFSRAAIDAAMTAQKEGAK